MNYLAVIRLSLLAICLTLTLAKDVWFGAPMFMKNTDLVRSRHIRSTYPHLPCVFMSQLIDIQNRFRRWLDRNNDGHATFEEAKAFLQRLKPDITDEKVSAFITRRDTDGNGSIELIPEYLREFVEGDYGRDAAAEWFHLHDVNGDGLVSRAEIIRLGELIGLSPEAARDTADSYYLPMDADGDGSLNIEEFNALYQPPPGVNF